MKGTFRAAPTLFCLLPSIVWAVPGLDPTLEIALGESPSAMVVGDFDNDGSGDFVVASANSASFTLYFGDGAGGVDEARPAVIIDAGSSFHDMATGDFDADGFPDIAGIHRDDSEATTWLNRDDGAGTRTFAKSGTLGIGNGAEAIIAANLDGHATDDIFVANSHDDTVTAFFGNGDGTFDTGNNTDTGVFPATLHIVDDHLLVLNALDGTLQMLSYDGVDALIASAPVSASSIAGPDGTAFPASIVSADLDVNGYVDVVVANLASNELYVLYGDGLGGFGEGKSVAVDWHSTEVQVDSATLEYQIGGVTRLPRPLALGDVVDDSNPDLVVAALNRKALLVFPGNDDGDFDSMQVFATQNDTDSIVVHDLDGTGLADAAGLSADSLQLFANVDSINRAPVVFDSVLQLEECDEAYFTVAHDVDDDTPTFATVEIVANYPVTFLEFLPVLHVETYDTGENAALAVATLTFTTGDGTSVSRTGSLQIEVKGDGNAGGCDTESVLKIADLRASERVALEAGPSISTFELSISAPEVSFDVAEIDSGEGADSGSSCAYGSITITGGVISTGPGFCSDFDLSNGIVTVGSGVSVSHDGSVIIVESSGNSSDDAETDENVAGENETASERTADASESDGGGGAWFWLGLPLLLLRRRV